MEKNRSFTQDYPLSSAQYGIYMECRMAPDSTMYNLPRALSLPAGTDPDRLREAIVRAVAVHPSLSAVFSMDGAEPVMRCVPRTPELAVITASSPEEAAKDFVRPFDLEKGPLFRFALCHAEDGDYLLFDLHHIVYDGTSTDLLLESILAAYEGKPLEEEELTQYDVALQDAALPESGEYQAAKEYFARQLEGLETDVTILSDVPADTRTGSDSLSLELGLDPDETAAFAEKLQIKESALFQGAFAYTLAGFTGSSDCCFATVTNGRHDSRLYRSVGMFVKTVPMRLSCAPEETVADFLTKVRKAYMEARQHDIVSFAELAHEYGVGTDITFTYQGGMYRDLTFCGGTVVSKELERTDNQMKLDAALFHTETGYRLILHWKKSAYSRELMESFADVYACVAKGMLRCGTLRELPLLSERQEARIEAFNRTEVPYRDDLTVVDLFLEAARKYPDRTAAVFEDTVLTYAQLHAISDRLAAYLKQQGIGKGGVVSVLINRSIQIPVASLGVLKTGAAYQPLDPSYPPERLSFMVKDADAKLLIADEELLPLLPDYKGPVLLTRDIAGLPAAEAPRPLPVPEDRFILLYTSGSTGVPKGVQLTHANLTAFCHWYHRYYELDETCKVLAYASYGFDACMMDLYSALTRGAAVYVLAEAKRLDFTYLDEYIRKNGITHSFMTTQVGRMFAVNMEGSSLRYLSMGGEKLVPFEPKGSCRYLNGYGPTECTIFSTVYPVSRFEPDFPIGKPLDNLKCYVTDSQGRSLPVGMPGELCISGPQVGLGYLNRPEKTAEAFVPNPFCSDPAYARMYKTGDIVARRADGNLCFIGRRDAQVKIRGFRIELTEVEEIIRRFPGIQDATVAAWDDENGGKFLAAYVVSGEKVDVEAMNRFIRSEKPPYMVPAATVQLEKIPLNQNQKVNRRALPRPERKKEEKEKAQAAPLNRLETELAALAEEVLHASVSDITLPLSDYGLTSISSIRLATLIYKKYELSLEVRELASGATLQSIENALLEKWMKAPEPAPESEAPVSAPSVPDSAPLSFAQQGVYADCQLDPDSTRYNMPFCLKLPSGVSAERLRSAVLAVVAAHGSMHSRFSSDDKNEILQVRVADYVPEIPVLRTDEPGLEERKKTFVRPFRLTEEVPARFEIAETGDGLYLLLDLHHLIADGASVDLFLSQLCLALDGKEVEAETEDYFNFSAGQQLSAEADAYFADRMSIAEEASRLIPDIFEEGLPHQEKSVSVGTDLEAASQLAARLGVTPAALYLAAVQLTVSRYLYEDVTAIATISNGRSDLRIHNTVGMFVNTLPLTASFRRGEKTAEFIRSVGADFAEAIRHEQYPFAKTASKYDFHPSVSYAWQVGVLQQYAVREGTVGVESLAPGEAKLPVSVFVEENAGSGVIRIAYDESLYSAEMMTGFALAVGNVVKEMAVRETLDEISLTDEAQWKILDSYNRPFDLSFNRLDSVVSGFQAQVKAHPDKTAAVFEEHRYTYRELDELTDRLAKVLYARIRKETGKESLAECVVSILCGRNENIFILPLAVLKTGCAYEPLDPSYPQERLNFMIRDAGACLLLAQDDLTGLTDIPKEKILLISELYRAPVPETEPVPPAPQDLFIMLYTSGSTGQPKGVQLEHRNMIAYAHGSSLDHVYTPDDVTAAYASFGFDVNMADTFCTLLNGGTVHLISQTVRMNLAMLADYFDRNGITEMVLTTQVGVQFLQNYPKMKSLRVLTLGGEKLPAVHTEELSYQLNNGYGPTENCCGVSLFPVRTWEPNIPLGKPMRTIHGFILDKTGHRLPAGAAGEYCLSGPQVSRGYLNRPEKTAEAYEDCPFNGFRMYHTGDVVRYRENGDVEFVGRKDNQVKIRGFRIETKEVEAVIREMEGVRDVTVQAFDYEAGGKYLAAWIVFDGELDTDRVAEFIRGRKPAYMVPSAIMPIDAIPLTVNQKVDKKALPKPVLQKGKYVEPQGKTEETFCRIFGELLGIDRVSAEDDFFVLGGSSITAMRVVIAAGKAGYDIVYQDVFSYPTPREMAQYLDPKETVPEESGPAEEEITEGIRETGPDGYDYAPIHGLLKRNTVENYINGEKQPLGEVLLAGATGYLGIHVLKELLEHDTGTVTCMVRPGQKRSGAKRLQDLLNFYFNGFAEEKLPDRIRVLEGDSTDPDALKGFRAQGVTVINCAASVKHFAKDNEIEKTNLETVRHLIEWCLENDSRLVHISTESVMGEAVGQDPPRSFRFTEHVLYAGQKTDGNQYISSKFAAERMVYETVLNKGLNARVIRMGNLAPRFCDGRFQVNFQTNSFLRNMAAYRELGVISYDAMDVQVEFSPIDYAARAVVLLSEAPKDCICFMASNGHLFSFGEAVLALPDADENPVRMVENTAFAAALGEALNDPDKSDKVSCLMAYNHGNGNENVRMLGPESIDTSLTRQILYRMGFCWPMTDSVYVKRFAERLPELFGTGRE